MAHYIVYVGDDPEDGHCRGPFTSFAQAVRNMSDAEIQWTVGDRPVDFGGPTIRGWHHALSSLYIVEHNQQGRPTWEDDIRPIMMKVHSGEIKRQYDEE